MSKILTLFFPWGVKIVLDFVCDKAEIEGRKLYSSIFATFTCPAMGNNCQRENKDQTRRLHPFKVNTLLISTFQKMGTIYSVGN